MARARKKKNTSIFKYDSKRTFLGLLLAFVVLMLAAFHYTTSGPAVEAQIVFAKEDPNFHVKTLTTQFFEDNDAAEMIPVIKCESHFKHYEDDGTLLKNREGSSAVGVAQIMSSVHPDPKIVARYNRKFDMDMNVEDFDITSLEGNLGYALVLYKIRGTRDWECGKKFSF